MSESRMLTAFVTASEAGATVPLDVVALSHWAQYYESLTPVTQTWWQHMRGVEPAPQSGQWLALPDASGRLERVVALVDDDDPTAVWQMGAWVKTLPAAVYQLHLHGVRFALNPLCLAWGMGAYRFDRYLKEKPKRQRAQLCWPDETVQAACTPWLTAIAWVRDLINTPANDCHPGMLAQEAQQLASAYDGQIEVIEGDALRESFPAVYAVGKGSAYQPRLAHARFGDPIHPKVVLVGKGVSFDSGGVNLKPSSGLTGMKKDMGGAAHALGLAQYLLTRQVPICLELIVPLVENFVSSTCYRTGDVIATRAGLSVEVNNTDAEGRLILADALALACESKPDVIIDFATLTGAQRIGMGPDIPSFYTDDPGWAARLAEQSDQLQDPIWQAPLYQPYADYLKSDIADLSNTSSVPYGGSITAALFLKRFVSDDQPWIHFDLMASNHQDRPGHPKGGEAMAIRACAAAIEDWLATR